MDMAELQGKTRQKLVVVGNGMAGIRTVEELLGLAPDLYDITVFGAEPHPNYNRILLSPVLAGEQDFKDIILNSVEVVCRARHHPHMGKNVATIDRVRRKVIAEDGTEAAYRLLLATGSTPFILPVPGKDLDGDQLPRHPRYRTDDGGRQDQASGGGDWRRPAGTGSCQRPEAARHGGHRGASG
jgi:nitrite reductase (NADH) large subunit